MSERYRGYRVPSARHRHADYGAGWFFVTVVTAGRVPWLSRIVDGRVRLGPAGAIVADEWERTGHVRPGVTPDAFVAMPDHVHLVIRLGGAGGTSPVPPAPADCGSPAGCAVPAVCGVPAVGVETPRRGVLPTAMPTVNAPMIDTPTTATPGRGWCGRHRGGRASSAPW